MSKAEDLSKLGTLASTAEMQAGTETGPRGMSPKDIADSIAALATTVLPDDATTVEMEAGTEAAIRSMSPVSVAEAVSALAVTEVVDDTSPELGGNLDLAGYDLLHIGASTNDTTDKGSISTGTVTFDVSEDGKQKLTVAGALTIAFSGWPTAPTYSECEIELINGGTSTITWASINWVISGGATSTAIADTGIALSASGSNYAVIWSDDGGSTLHGVIA
jgi:hypothetical protein